jgi:hypothetical protein
MFQASVLSGRVITEDGEPASQTTIQAYTFQYSDGERRLAQAATAQTNDLGEYRLFWLEPGEYFVSVTPRGAGGEPAAARVEVGGARRGGVDGLQEITAVLGPLVEALTPNAAVVFYPGTIDPGTAVPINVGTGTETRGVDFNLRPIPTVNISGRIAAPFPLGVRGQSANPGPRGGGRRGDIQLALGNAAGRGAGAQVSLSREGAVRSGLLPLLTNSTPVADDGSFEIRGVSPGGYILTATAADPENRQYTARTRIDVANADISNITLAVRPGAEIRGRIVLDGQPPASFRMTQLRVGLVSEDSPLGALAFNLNLGGRGIATALQGDASATVAEDGTFTLTDVGAAEYRLRVNGLPQGAYVETGRLGSVDVLNGPFTLNDTQQILQLQLGFSPGRVTGVVYDAARNPVIGATAVLVPEEARRGRSELYLSTTTDSRGQFTFSAVPAGNYKVFAWEDVPSGAWQYPDFIRRFEDRGQPLNLSRNGAATIETLVIRN